MLVNQPQHRRDRGAVLLFVGIAMVAAIAAAALAVDMGHNYTEARRLQTATDSAALAAAQAYVAGDPGCDEVTLDFLARNVGNASLTSCQLHESGDIKWVTVDASLIVEQFFATAIGVAEVTTTASSAAALSGGASRTRGVLGTELARTMHDIRIGVDRTRALTSLSERTGSDDVDSLVSSLLQGLETGMPLSPILEARAHELRRKRRAAAEEKAHKLSVKMAFPTAVCILPALLLVVIGPAVLEMATSGFGG